MEKVTRHVRELNSDEKRIYESVLGRELRENQQVILHVITLGEPAEVTGTTQQPAGSLPEWCNVYEGLSDNEISDIEAVILDRGNWTRSSPSMQLSLLDTDILSEFLKKKNPAVFRHGAEYLASYQQFAISAITRYEIMRGLKDKNATRQLKNFEVFCQNNIILPITDEIFDHTSDLWVEARKGGHPRRDPDLIIAATALEHGRSLVTGNTSDFFWVPGLIVENWRDA